MNYRPHRLVHRDVKAAFGFYRREAGEKTADQFFEELISLIDYAAENPRHLARELETVPVPFFLQGISGIHLHSCGKTPQPEARIRSSAADPILNQ